MHVEEITTLLIALMMLFVGAASASAGEDFPGGLPFPEKERLNFDIDVLFLKRVATGTAEIVLVERENLVYKATVDAEVKKFFLYRRNIYEAMMRFDPEEGRFKPISFVESKYKRSKSYMKKTYYDKEKGMLVEERWRNGKLDKIKETPLAEDEFREDVVTAFYNLRIQAYGKVEEGKEFLVRSMHRDGKFYFTINILDGKKKRKVSSKEKDCLYNSKYYVEVKTPKEVFDAQGGRLFVGFTQDLLPNFVLVRKVLGIGTIRGRLVNFERGISDLSIQNKDSAISKKFGKE